MAPADEVNIIHVLSWSEWKVVGQERRGEQGSYSLPLCRLPRAQADVGTPVLSSPRFVFDGATPARTASPTYTAQLAIADGDGRVFALTVTQDGSGAVEAKLPAVRISEADGRAATQLCWANRDGDSSVRCILSIPFPFLRPTFVLPR